MNSTQIFNLLETIANHPKKTDKERLLMENDCPELRRVLKAAYDPTVSYYVKKVPEVEPYVQNLNMLTLGGIDCLSSRELTGERALSFIRGVLGGCNKQSQELLTRILKRDLRAGFSASTINKVFKGLIPEFPYMQYSLLSKVKPETLFEKGYTYCQLKADGMFMSVNIYEDGTIEGLSRQGTIMPEEPFAQIFEYMTRRYPVDIQYHGEVLVYNKDGVLPREIGNGLLNSIAKGGSLPEDHWLTYSMWDMVELDVIQGKKVCDKTYEQRWARLEAISQIEHTHQVKSKKVYNMEQAFEVYAKALVDGHEGVMLKSPDLMWKDHKTTKGCKLKLEVDVDLEIYGFTEGKGKNALTFGAIQCKTVDDKLKVDVSGMSDELRSWVSEHRDELLGTVASVRANDITKTGSLFLPRLIELRTDKTVADTFEMVVESFENAKMGKM